TVDDAKALVAFCSNVASKVNIIEYNEVENLPFQKSSENKTALFLKTVYEKKINVKLRRSRGIDIDAACGQLANKQKKIIF
ncbi:MAG: 23S rRNA (adenine(2503)-C(2))-methyltransferase RlmN, partial [Bacteroidetes bacterium]|nr:23S rRNA (adenine(2503)-C(2))-methyltransferase RlmN [Bacteroidota bacterium]